MESVEWDAAERPESRYGINHEKSLNFAQIVRAVTKALIGGGGGGYSYLRVLPDEFLLKSVVITVDFKRNSSGRTRIYEYAPPPPQLTL